MSTTLIDFSETPLSSNYSGFYAKILDDVFSLEECKELAGLVGDWEPAGLSAEGPTQTVHKEFRNSDRCLVFNREVAEMVYQRLRPLVEEIHRIEPTSQFGLIIGKAGRKQGPTYELIGVNERLSFLRYGPGHYFKPHCDGLIELEDNEPKRKSFVTLHLYLNDAGLEGGATRFWTPNKKHFLDVEPKVGRVLVFQQRMLIHSGEEVSQGEKYTMRSDFLFQQTS
ncbi:hypothetical protein CC1G_08045 [Coprinopsis cinerea okayama7|uniref:Fe2OG dioxygenase domain-containing protein n=1 Tax=Coprinopsis cinerea (strain Okayama-7 / 130 / ATCC MYA-4618 / FGSC 9003) TaxID=240176 RepID=A8NQE2_COPC7|nr:hypothetical protein CC1G_08045 [Coprinopsis cinerea okayama7\|eukprot:XP_001835536.1 hypothetical protein CC1G_08045 [Coprinopsis cinerea okayama7\